MISKETISIIIPNWNGLHLLKKCIPSVIKAVSAYGDDVEIIVVDNGSSDGSVDYLQSNFPQIRIIALKQNLGFTAAMNIGIKEAKGEIIIGLNNDVIVEEGFILPLVEHFSNGMNIFAVAAKMLLEDKKTLNFGKTKGGLFFGLLRIKFEDALYPVYTLYACGGAFAVDKKKFRELGGFDEDLDYYQDADLCLRAWKRGYRVIYEPRSIAYHRYQATARKRYGRYGLAVLSKRDYFLFIWKNIHDKILFWQHILFLPFWNITALSLGKFYFTQGLFHALKSIPLFLKKRNEQKQMKAILPEREILNVLLKQDVRASSKTKILQVGKFYHPYTGGTELHLITLVNELKKNSSWEIDILVSNTRPKTEIEADGNSRIIKLACLGNLFSVPLSLTLPFWLKKLKADILHFHLPNPLAVISYLLVRPKGRVIVSYHSDIIRQRIFMPFFKPWLVNFLKKSEAIIVTSPNLIDNSGILKKFRQKCRVVPHGINIEQFRQTDKVLEATENIRKEYGSPLILFVGRLVYYKGLEFLIKAMKEIRTRLLVIGDGPLKKKLMRLSRRINVGDKIIWLGDIENERLAPFYYACDIFVLPSSIEAESFGIVQVEAFACGKPVVSTNLPTGVTFVNQHEITGLIVPPKDTQALSLAINRLLGSQELRQRYSGMARQRAEKEFTKEMMAEGVARVYFE